MSAEQQNPQVTDSAEVLAAVPPALRNKLTARSDRAGLFHLCGHMGLVLGGAATILWLQSTGFPGWWLLLPLQGILLVFLFTLAHECTHQTPFRTAWLNTLCGHMAGVILVLPFQWFRAFHMAHHRFTNDPLNDPETAGGGLPKTPGGWIWHVSGLPYWYGQIALLFHLARGIERASYITERQIPRFQREAQVYLAVYAVVFCSFLVSPLLFWVWLLPVVLGQPALRLYLLAEHGDCPQVANMFLNTRTTFTTRAVRFLAWNMPYHCEHHVWPTVPFHQLPALHGHIRDHLRQTENGYVRFTAKTLARLSH